MNEQLIQFLWRYGYFWFDDQWKSVIKQTDLGSLTLTHPSVVSAMARWQAADVNFDILSQLFHGRAIQADGDVGPVTQAMLLMRRCAMPDVPPPEGVSFDFGNPSLNKAISSMRSLPGATGSGSWPVPGCDLDHANRPTTHSIRVALDVSRCPAKIKEYLDKALAEVSKAYAEIGLAVRYVQHSGTVPDCEIDKKFQSLGGSVIGWNEFPSPNTCNQTIDGRLDTGYAPDDWRLFANLECHETGHGVGLQHGRGSIMNPSILLVWPLTWVGTYSYANLKRWFGGEPIGPPVPPTPVHPKLTGKLFAEPFSTPPKSGIAIRGELLLEDKYEYIVVPDESGTYYPVPKPVI